MWEKTGVQVPAGARKRGSIPWSWSYRWRELPNKSRALGINSDFCESALS